MGIMNNKDRAAHIKSTKMHLLRQTNLCGICGKQITQMKDATIDHIVPTSKGGHDGLSNLQLAHVACNQEKGDTYDVD